MSTVPFANNGETALPRLRGPAQRTGLTSPVPHERARRRSIARRVAALSRQAIALPILCAVYVLCAAAVAVLAVSPSGVTLDATRHVVAVAPGSEASLVGVQPGWEVAAVSDGVTSYTNGESIRVVVEDLLRLEPERTIQAPISFLLFSVAALLVRSRRLAAGLAIAGATSMAFAFTRLGVAGIPFELVPILLGASLVWAVYGDGSRSEAFRRSIVIPAFLGALPLLGAPAALLAGHPDMPLPTAVGAYLGMAWLLALAVAGIHVRDARPESPGAALSLAALELFPLAARLRQGAVVAERERLAGDLHAEILPRIASTAAALETQGAADAAVRLRDLASDVRELVSQRRLPLLEDEGLIAAAEWLAESLEARSSLRIEISLAGDTGVRPPQVVESAAYRVLQLALDNVIAHAGATTATVGIAGSERSLDLTIRDDGLGFGEAASTQARRTGHIGLLDMHAAADSIDGILRIGPAPTAGTVVRLSWRA